MNSRKIKQEVLALLATADREQIFHEMRQYAEKDLINPLFAALCRPEDTMRWHAIDVFGRILPRLAEQDMEAARIVMRRLLWSLNDESGGIGWGAPEAMAEVMLHHDRLAEEYLHMLLSYLRQDGPLRHQDGNFLELPFLQRGLLWGIGRLASRRAAQLISRGVVADLLPYLHSEDGEVRGLAVWALSMLAGAAVLPEADRLRAALLPLTTDSSQVRLYRQARIQPVSVAELVVDALLQINSAPSSY